MFHGEVLSKETKQDAGVVVRKRRQTTGEDDVMLSPKRVRFRKRQRRVKRDLRGSAFRGNTIAFGDFGPRCIGGRVGHQPPDRGGAYRYDTENQTGRESMDTGVPGRTIYEKAR